jgi:hypothetical protein
VIIRETLDEALVKPSTPRVFAHVGCGGWVLFDLRGGFCIRCHAGPVKPGDYEKPETRPCP